MRFSSAKQVIFIFIFSFFVGLTSSFVKFYLFPQKEEKIPEVFVEEPLFDYQQRPDFHMEVGEEEHMIGPVSGYLDGPFYTIPTQNGIRGYSSGFETVTFWGADLESLQIEGVAIKKGGLGNWDECGAWLYSIYKITEQHWIGWYYGERICRYDEWKYVGSTGFTESFDAGKTWAKPDYPNNQVISRNRVHDGLENNHGVGNGNVIEYDGYFYMFLFVDADNQIHLARSKVTDLGKPETWYKYYNGSFSEPGLGGKSSPISEKLADRIVTYNTYLNRFISTAVSGLWGFTFFFSSDLLHWHNLSVDKNWKVFYPHVSYYQDSRVDHYPPHTSGSGYKQAYLYPSLIGLDGSSNVSGREFYQYYTKVFDNDDNSLHRNLMRRKIRLYKDRKEPYYVYLTLIRYDKDNGQKVKVSTEVAKPSEGFIRKNKIGYVLPYDEKDFISLYECYVPSFKDYFLTTVDPAQFNWEHCETTSDVFIRRVGYISWKETQFTTKPIYRCLNEASLDHFISTNENCDGHKNDYLLGYIFDEQIPSSTSSPSPTPMPSATPSPTPTSTSTPTLSPTSTPAPSCQYDYNDNGKIGTGDLLYLLGQWGSGDTARLLQVLGNWGLSCE